MKRDNSRATRTRLDQNSTRNVNNSNQAQLNSNSTRIISTPNGWYMKIEITGGSGRQALSLGGPCRV